MRGPFGGSRLEAGFFGEDSGVRWNEPSVGPRAGEEEGGGVCIVSEDERICQGTCFWLVLEQVLNRRKRKHEYGLKRMMNGSVVVDPGEGQIR